MSHLQPKSLNTVLNTPLPLITILVIDDDCEDSSFITDAIKELYPQKEVICLDKVEIAIAYLESLAPTSLPTLVIVDYSMPILDGIDFLKWIKTKDVFSGIPVVVYSHSTFPKHRAECLSLGAALYLTKSSSVAALHEDVKQMLAHGSSLQQ